MKFSSSSRKLNTRKLAFSAVSMTAMVLGGGLYSQAMAQSAVTPAADSGTSGDIVVTARRREESIVDVPLAISVVTDAQIERLGLTSTEDVANFVPGLQFSDFTPGNSRNDRGGNRPIIFRGLNLARNGGVTGAASMYLDGAAVIGNEIPAGMDIGAVEVLRGPQNVYFGRSSMTGAISYRSKSIPDEWTFGLSVTGAERETYRVEGSAAGHIVPDLLGVRVTALKESNDGFITNAYNPGGQKLGARSRQSISGTVDFTPAETFEVKLYANYFEDDDGVSATVNIFPDATVNATTGAATLGAVTNCLRGTATGPLASQQPRPTICGKVPDKRFAVAYSRTDIPANHAASTFSVPYLQDQDFERKAGMQRNVFNSHGIVNWDISDYVTFQSITGYHTNAVIQVVDGHQQPVQAGSGFSILYFGLANKFSDYSQEFRLSSDPDRAFSWTAGINYVKAKNLSSATNTRTSNTQPTLAVPNPVQTYTPLLLNIGDDRAETSGFFAGGYLKLFDDRFTIGAEGRYQIDERENTQIAFLTGVKLNNVSERFKSFNPRVSLDYDVGGNRKVYASYAEGSRPGGFNNGLLSFYDGTNSVYSTNPALTVAAVTAQIDAAFGGFAPSYDEEKLGIYEIGFKGNLAGGKGFFDINAYHGTLTEQQITITALIPILTTSLSNVTNKGELDIYGVEFTGSYDITPDLSLATSFAYNKTERSKFIDTAPASVRLYGITDYSGLETPNTPEYTASAVLSYEPDSGDGWSPFGNVAAVYRGKQWADIANYAYIDGRTTVDLRLGAKNETLRAELFVTNLFDDDNYPGGNVASDFGGNPRGSDQGFYGAYADPRTFGARFSADF